jgi:hypothetical protein
MTKSQVLRSIDSLIKDIDVWNDKRVAASLKKDDEAYREAMFELEGLIIDTMQELTCLRDWIDVDFINE